MQTVDLGIDIQDPRLPSYKLFHVRTYVSVAALKKVCSLQWQQEMVVADHQEQG